MALPEYWLSVNRKDLAERAIIAQRNKEAHQVERHESAARYHRELNFLSSQYKNLEEQPVGKVSKVNEESRLVEEAKVKRREKVHFRRERLKVLLAKENELYLAELKTVEEAEQGKDPWNISKLKDQIEELKQRREKEEEELAKRNTYQLYQTNIPYLQEYALSLNENEVKEAVEKRKKDLEKQAFEKAEEDKKLLEELEKLREEAAHDLEVAEQEKNAATKQYKDLLQMQANEITKNKDENEKMLATIQALQNYSNLVSGVKSKRREVQDIQVQKEKQIAQFRPSKEKVRKMSAEVRHRLELDLATLNYLSELERNQQEILRICLDMNQVTSAKESVLAQITGENLREAEIQSMFEEEATDLWNRRKREWDAEKEVHEETMRKVFESLILQLEEKLKTLLRTQKELLEVRDNYLSSMIKNINELKEEIRTLTEKADYFQNKVSELDEKVNRIRNMTKKPPQLLNRIII